MNKVLCYCEMNASTGFGHYSRINILLKILRLKRVNIITENYSYAKKYFKGHKIIKNNNLFQYLNLNINKYNLLILDPPYYPAKKNDYEKFSLKFKKIFYNKRKTFKTLWLTDETKPSPKYCDVLVNDFPESTRFKKYYLRFNKKIKLILGIYSFLFQKKIFKTKNKKHILIAFGGDDPKNLIFKYFDFLKNIDEKKIFITNKKVFKRIKKYQDRNNLIIKKKEPKEKFLKLLSQSKSYISTPSNIMFEAWSLGIPGNVIPIQKRQLEMGKSFKKLKIVNLLPYYNEISFLSLKRKIKFKFSKFKIKFKKNRALHTHKQIKSLLKLD